MSRSFVHGKLTLILGGASVSLTGYLGRYIVAVVSLFDSTSWSMSACNSAKISPSNPAPKSGITALVMWLSLSAECSVRRSATGYLSLLGLLIVVQAQDTHARRVR